MITAWTSKGKVVASYRNGDKLITKAIGDAVYTAFAQREVPGAMDISPDFPGWFKHTYLDYEDRKRALALNPDSLFEADVSPVRRFMADHSCIIEPGLRCYLDIETDSRVPPRVQVEENKGRILSWGLQDQKGKKYCGVLEEDSNEAEGQLLTQLWDALSNYDQCAAWYGDGFDFPRIKDRSSLLKKYLGDSYWSTLWRILFVDQLGAYERFNVASESGDEKTSKALGKVAQKWLGQTKHDFDASKTWEFWERGGASRKEMVDYMMQDVALLPLLDDKTEFLDIFQTLCGLTTALPNSHGLKPMAQVDALMLRKAHTEGTHLPSKKHTEDAKQYEGAFVMESKIVGIQKDVHVCDFASLYPSVILSWNMGHETKGGIGCVSPGTGVTFATDTVSMLASVVGEGLKLRGVYKKKKAALTPGTPDWKDADRKSTAYKVFNNSIYGVMGNVHGRYYDLELVESITLNSQWLIKQVIVEAEARGMTTVYGDTDSLYVSGTTQENFAKLIEDLNTEIFPRLMAEQGCRADLNCIKLAYEKTFKRIVVPQGNDGGAASKRYCGSYLMYEGTPALPVAGYGVPYDPKLHSEPEIKGLEYKRSDSAKLARVMQERAIRMLLGDELEDPNYFEQWILSEREKLANGDVDEGELVKSAAISQDLELYKTCGPHVRLAKEMAKKGLDVSEGTRVEYVVVDGSVSPAKVVATADYTKGTFDRLYYWNKVIYPPTMRLLAGAFPERNWKRWLIKKPPKNKMPLPGQLGLL